MTEAVLNETSNVAAIQAAILDICLTKQSGIAFNSTSSRVDSLPKPEDLAAANGQPPPLPAVFVLAPRDVTPPSQGLDASGIERIDWEFDVYCLWQYEDDKAQNDTAVKNAIPVMRAVFSKEFDLEGTCAPTARARGFQKVYWSQLANKSDAPEWVALHFIVYAHEDLDIQYLPSIP